MKKLTIGLILLILLMAGTIISQAEEDTSGIVRTALGFSKTVDMPFEQALEQVKTELKKEGFGILTEVDVKKTMKNKLDIDYRPYHILGACNPPLAHKALQAEEQIGLMLPCKFIVYMNSNDQTVIAAVDPATMMADIENEQLAEVARTVQEKFTSVLTRIGQ
jgi:uncharacterized protein (DUF302 family)